MEEKILLQAQVKKIDKKICQAINNVGISYPHPSLAFFRGVYAKVDGISPNGNGVILGTSVKDDVKYLKGTQINRDHIRKSYILGSIIDAFINQDDEIEIIFTLAKNVYPEDYDEALELINQGKLHLSFELMVDKKDVEILKSGHRKINHCSFDGAGLLFDVTPAYKDAHVLSTAMKIIEDAFANDNPKMVFASAKDITKKWIKIGEMIEKAISDKEDNFKENDITLEGDEIMDEKAKDALLAKQKEFVVKEFGEEAVKDWTDEDFLNQDKIDAFRESLKANTEEVVSEENKVVEETEKKEEIAVEEVKKDDEVKSEEAQKVNNVTKETRIYDVTTDDAEGTMEVTETIVTEEERDGQVVKEEVVVRHTLYTQPKVDQIKAEYEQKIEVLTKQADFYKENAKVVAEIRAELGDFVKDFTDEEILNKDKVENARLKKQLEEAKKITIASADNISADDKELKTGDEIVKEDEVVETKEDRIDMYLKTKYGKTK